MRSNPQPAVALGQRRAHAKQFPALQRGEIAMDQPARGRGRRGAEVVLLQQQYPQTPSRGIARNADAVQPTADNCNIVVRHPGTISSDIIPPWQVKAGKTKPARSRPETWATSMERPGLDTAQGQRSRGKLVWS